MSNESSRLETLRPYEPFPGTAREEPWLRSGRVKLFAVIFGAVLLAGVVSTLLQPVLYRSSATVLMSAPQTIDAEVALANVQNVAIQRRILLSRDITGQVVERLQGIYPEEVDARYLAQVLQVVPVADTNLVEMMAQGEDEMLLPDLVDTWIDVYIRVRAQDIEQNKNNSMQLVQDELLEMEVKIDLARDALEQYREEHDIVSATREENEVLSRLDGLNKAMNKAVEEEVKARVYLDTVREAVRQGQVVIPADERASLQSLEEELQELRGQLLEMNKRYTGDYIQKQPQLRAVPERIAELEAEISSRLSKGGQVELLAARQAHVTARRAVDELQIRLDAHKEAVKESNRIYATHQALAEDLASLEELNREGQARLVQMEVNRVEKYPQVTVIEHPGAIPERVGPDYLIWLGGSLVAAFIAGIVGVWLYGFLGHNRAQPAYVTLSGVHMYPQEGAGELAYSGQADPRLARSDTRLLQEDSVAPSGEGDDISPGEEGREPG